MDRFRKEDSPCRPRERASDPHDDRQSLRVRVFFDGDDLLDDELQRPLRDEQPDADGDVVDDLSAGPLWVGIQ